MTARARIKRDRPSSALLVAACLLCALLPPAVPAYGADPADAAAETIEALWSRGEAAFRASDLGEALRMFETALGRDDRRARSWNYVGGVHFARGDFRVALEKFRKALELDPGDVRACNNIGTALERLGDFAGAEAAYSRAALIDPSYPLSQRNLGILQSRRLGNPDAARRAWRRYQQLAPTGPYADEIRNELSALDAAKPLPPAPALVPDAPRAPAAGPVPEAEPAPLPAPSVEPPAR
jgi:tetratricopeptide (TPR) repeat protein